MLIHDKVMACVKKTNMKLEMTGSYISRRYGSFTIAGERIPGRL